MALTPREYRDRQRENWVSNPAIAPTRSIKYTPSGTLVEASLEALVSKGEFNADLPEDKKVNTAVFAGLKLLTEPTRTDKVEWDGKFYTVREWKLVGTLYTVYAENAKRNKVTSRKFSS